MKDKTISLSELPQPPSGVSFKLAKVENVTMPHPYCITPRHVGIAADHYNGILGPEAIRAAERAGACCDICRHSGRGILPFDKHETSLTVFITVPQNHNLNGIEGLHNYLYTNKAQFEALGIQGFAFPTN